MKIIDNVLTNKLTTHILFQVVQDGYFPPKKYKYGVVGLAVCLVCGRINIEESNADYGPSFFSDGLCNECYSSVDKYNHVIIDLIREFLNGEALRLKKLLKGRRLYKKDWGKIKRYKVQVPKDIMKEINGLLMIQSKRRLARYRAKISRSKLAR